MLLDLSKLLRDPGAQERFELTLDFSDMVFGGNAPAQEPVKARRSQRKNLSDVVYYPSTNDHALVCAFRPRTPERKETTDWYLVSLLAAPDADTRGNGNCPRSRHQVKMSTQ